MVRDRVVAACAALPPLLLTLTLAALAIAEQQGTHIVTPGAPRNPSEAVAQHDESGVLKLLHQQGPNGVGEVMMVRGGLLREERVFVSPLEAAVFRNDLAGVRFLAARGAPLRSTSAHLSCLARDLGHHPLAEALASLPPEGCEPGRTLAAVLARP